jgi:hypothetical protein
VNDASVTTREREAVDAGPTIVETSTTNEIAAARDIRHDLPKASRRIGVGS